MILVTSDADFLDFRDYIREVLSVDAERPDDAARLLASAVREREWQGGRGWQACGRGRPGLGPGGPGRICRQAAFCRQLLPWT